MDKELMSRLLTPEESQDLVDKWRYDVECSVEWLAEEVAKAQDARTASIKDAENKELGLLLEARIGGVDEFNDWSETGLRSFREQVLPIIREHCWRLKNEIK